LPPKLRWLIPVLAGLFLAGVIGLIVLFCRSKPHDTLEFELAKALLQFEFQFVLVAGIGTLVSVLMFEYQQRSKKLIRREKFLRSILTRATKAYSDVKKTRQLLWTRAIDGGEAGGKMARTGEYDLRLEMIIDAQLELKNLARDIKTSEQTFSDPTQTFSDPGVLRARLSEMGSYLGKLVKEYEKAFEMCPPTSLALTDLPRLEGFTAASTKGDFKKQFSDPFRAIQRDIRRDLLPPNLNAAEAKGESIINAEALQKYAPDEFVEPKPTAR
jgi:hypothetical protein